MEDCYISRYLPAQNQNQTQPQLSHLNSTATTQLVGTKEGKPKFKFLSVFRHPVDRVISEYYWWFGQQGRWTDHMDVSKHEGIEEWVKDPTNIANNKQAMYYLLEEPFPQSQTVGDGKGDIQCVPYQGNKALHWIQTNYGSVEAFNNMTIPTNKDIFRLDRFVFIGMLDYMEQSEQKFRKIFGLPLMVIESNNNATTATTKKKSQKTSANATSLSMRPKTMVSRQKGVVISNDTRKLIEQYNRLDMIMYQTIKQRIFE